MVLHPDEFPITIQAFEINNNRELFVAEQVVNSQQEVEAFSQTYSGKVIKAKAVSSSEKTTTSTTRYKKRGSGLTIFLVILFIIIILLAIGYYTGWLQKTTGINF